MIFFEFLRSLKLPKELALLLQLWELQTLVGRRCLRAGLACAGAGTLPTAAQPRGTGSSGLSHPATPVVCSDVRRRPV